MANFNRVIIAGHLTRDVDLRRTDNDTAVAEIGMAINDRRKTQAGEWMEEVTFVDVTLWGRTAEIADEFLSKGAPLLVEGRLKLDTWETDDGQKRSKLRVIGERMQLLSRRLRPLDESEHSKAAQTNAPEEDADSSKNEENAPSAEDVPF